MDWSSVPPSAGMHDRAVQATLTGPALNTTYHFCLAASNQDDVIIGDHRSAVLAGTASITRCYVGANSVQGGNGARHGSFNFPIDAGDGLGGALFNAGIVGIQNSTFAENTASPRVALSGYTQDLSSGKGGAIAHADGSMQVVFSTIAHNAARRGTNHIGEPLGAGIFTTTNTLTLGNSILAWNTTDPTSSANSSGAVIDAGNNLSSDATPALISAGSVNNVDPLLGPLANNGGPTFTFPLLPGSPAIDTANPSGAPATDQRGVSRPQGPAPDIGAHERE
jgi:hypothetical protein